MLDRHRHASWILLVGLGGCAQCESDCEEPCILDESASAEAGSASDASSETNAAEASTGASEDASGTSAATAASSSTGADGTCGGTDECDGQFCVAPYADNVRGAFACVSECVGPMDEAVWCYDDAACCDAAAHCTIRGYCELDDGGSTSTTDGGSSGSGSG